MTDILGLRDLGLSGIDWITGDIGHALIFIIIIMVIFFVWIMSYALNLDDRIHGMLTEVFIGIVIFLLLTMANNGVIDASLSQFFT
jgi:hypothetical protein